MLRLTARRSDGRFLFAVEPAVGKSLLAMLNSTMRDIFCLHLARKRCFRDLERWPVRSNAVNEDRSVTPPSPKAAIRFAKTQHQEAIHTIATLTNQRDALCSLPKISMSNNKSSDIHM